MLYFAYGSNMDEARMTEPNRCPNARFIFKAVLTGYRLAFTRQTQAGTGAADILAADGCAVRGVVYDINS
jgi:gamma-glutamylcyclotransferase